MARKPRTNTTDMSEAPKSSAAVKRGLSSTAEKRRGLSSAAEKRGLSSTAEKKAKMSGGRSSKAVISKEDQVDDDGSSQYPYFEAGCGLVPECFKIDKRRMSSVPLADKKELEKSWSLYFKEEAALKMKRLDLLHRHCMMMMRPTGDSGSGKNLV